MTEPFYEVQVETTPPPAFVIHVPGPQGPKGNDNLVVSPTNPNLTEPGLWIQTFEDGSISFWVEDGV